MAAADVLVLAIDVGTVNVSAVIARQRPDKYHEFDVSPTFEPIQFTVDKSMEDAFPA